MDLIHTECVNLVIMQPQVRHAVEAHTYVVTHMHAHTRTHHSLGLIAVNITQ